MNAGGDGGTTDGQYTSSAFGYGSGGMGGNDPGDGGGGGGGGGFFGGGGGAADCAGGSGGGGSGFVNQTFLSDGSSYAGDASDPANKDDPLRGSAGNGGLVAYQSGADGLVVIGLNLVVIPVNSTECCWYLNDISSAHLCLCAPSSQCPSISGYDLLTFFTASSCDDCASFCD